MIDIHILMNVLISVVLFTSLLIFCQLRFTSFIRIFAAQSLCIALLAAASAESSGNWHLYVSALLAVALKVIFIPYILKKIAQHGGVSKLESSLSPTTLIILSVVVAVSTFWFLRGHVLLPNTEFATIGVSTLMILLGFLMMIIRRDMFSQIIAFFLMENALFTFGLSLLGGMPLIVELGVFFDASVASILLATLSYKVQREHGSIHTTVLKELIES